MKVVNKMSMQLQGLANCMCHCNDQTEALWDLGEFKLKSTENLKISKFIHNILELVIPQ